MNYWMTEERREIARRYIFDMINPIVEEATIGRHAHMEYDLPTMSFYVPNIEQLLEKACYNNQYSVKHLEFGMLHDAAIKPMISMIIACL